MAGNWTEFTIGIIMIISPWVLGFSDITLAKWCNVLIGLILVLMSSWMMFGDHPSLVPGDEGFQKGKRKIKNNVEQK